MRIGQLLTSSAAVTVDSLLARSKAVAARGMNSAWTNQQPGGWDPLGVFGPLRDEGPAELGTAIVPTYLRHPVVMATEALTVQAATGGRLTLGIGPSHEIAMTGQFGIPYTASASHTREYLEVLRPLLQATGARLPRATGPSHEIAMTGQLGIRSPASASHTREYLEVLRPLL